ncbi:MAG: hypothetical protein C5S44_09905 [Candidatus Methanocomedens sp.]|nr:MAG: hypothetical protein C5S44_09905 [ANME-2 cluster archaeon]
MEVIDEGIYALVRQNIYSSKEAVITDAVLALLELKPGLKIEIAINLYKNNKVSYGKRPKQPGLGWKSLKISYLRKTLR